jgi:hypothetical protein
VRKKVRSNRGVKAEIEEDRNRSRDKSGYIEVEILDNIKRKI